jgi:hypothetical protein
MRCPKCGYISFDHVDSCLKCNKDISKVSSAVEGTTYNVAPPSFLRFSSGEKLHDDEERTEISFDEAQEDYDVIDPDLDVLVNDEEEQSDDAGISFGDELDGFGQLADEDGFELESNDDEIDLGQFEDAFENEEQQSGGTEEIDIDLPDELADISDLSAPAGDDLDKSEMYDGVSDEAPAEKNGMDDFNLDLDLDQLDDDFSLTSDDEEGDSPGDDVLGDLSLDDIGLSHTEETKEAAKKKEVDPMDMDADLDFDLDLGGISLDDK